MRGTVVDWLVEVAEEYKLSAETLHLAVSYIDRFLSFVPINRKRFQLLGVASMLIASKYEEIKPPSVEDFCEITANSYTMKEVVKMESDILNFLNFEMGNPTAKTFLKGFIEAGQDNSKYPDRILEFLSSYLAELSLLDYSCVRFLPSVIAASAVFVSRFTINSRTHPWSKTLQSETGYNLSELKDCICTIHDLQLSRKRYCSSGIREKYNQDRFKCVSTLLPPLKIPTFYFEGF